MSSAQNNNHVEDVEETLGQCLNLEDGTAMLIVHKAMIIID